MIGSRFHHYATHISIASIKNMIETLLQKAGCALDIGLNDSNVLLERNGGF
jgi:hypothetical protein